MFLDSGVTFVQFVISRKDLVMGCEGNVLDDSSWFVSLLLFASHHNTNLWVLADMKTQEFYTKEK